MLLGTATWSEGPAERRALVARLPSGRLADLNRIEAIRLRKLDEGEPERLADALVPSSLRRVLEGGPRALARVRHTVAYAESWDRKGTLPEALARDPSQAVLSPCLARPSLLRDIGGQTLDRFGIRGHGAQLSAPSQPGLAAIGMAGGGAAGFCLALQDAGSAVLGAWMVDQWPMGSLELRAGSLRRSASLKAPEEGYPALRPGEVVLFPVPKWKALPEMLPGGELILSSTGLDQLVLRLPGNPVHPTVQ